MEWKLYMDTQECMKYLFDCQKNKLNNCILLDTIKGDIYRDK